MNSDGRQLSFCSAARFFRQPGRLTGFGSARNIIRIRTKPPGGDGHGIFDPD
jgi:hypothetical protein